MLRTSQIRSRLQRGQSLLETAMMIVVIFTVVFWIFELGWLMYTYAVMADAANEGVRYAIVHSGGDSGRTQARVENLARNSLHYVNALFSSVKLPDGSATPPKRVRRALTYAYRHRLRQFISTPTIH